MKKFWLVLIVASLVLNITGVALAKGGNVPPPSEREAIPFTYDSSGEFTIQSKQYLMTGTSYIDSTGTTVYASGNTYAYQSVDVVGITFYLQQYKNGTWYQIASWSGDEAYNTDYVYDATGGKSVTSGYYYRVRGYHYVEHNGVYESGSSYTAAKLIQ